MIAQRLGVSAAYGGVYRERLINAGLIHDTAHGYVDFTMPTMRDYLQTHTTTEVLGEPETTTADDAGGSGQ